MNGRSVNSLTESLLTIYEKVPYTVRKDAMDDFLFGRHKNRLTEKVRERIQEPPPQIPPLVADTFNVFYKPQPRFLDDYQIAPEFRLNKRVLEKVMNTNAFSELKASTTLDDVNSAIATAILTEKLYEELKSRLREIRDHTEKIQQLRNQLPRRNEREFRQAVQQIEQHDEALQSIVTQGAISVAVIKAQEVAEARRCARYYEDRGERRDELRAAAEGSYKDNQAGKRVREGRCAFHLRRRMQHSTGIPRGVRELQEKM